jgi:hypothetical protein
MYTGSWLGRQDGNPGLFCQSSDPVILWRKDERQLLELDEDEEEESQ